MTTHQTATFASHRSPVLAALLCAVPLALVACDKHDKTAHAVRKGADQLQETSGGVGPLAAENHSRKQFNEVVADLKLVSDQGLPDENAAALVLTARSQLGLALQPAAAASAQEADSQSRALVIASQLGAWIDANAAASAQEQFDPSALIAESRKDADEKAKQAEAMAQEKSKIDKQVADLRAQAAEKNAQAKAEEDQYAGFKGRATKLTPVQAEPVIKEAAVHRRASDKLRTEAQLLEARADQIAPQSAEAQLQIEQFQNQKKNLETTAAQLIERAEASKTEASRERARAAKIAAEIEKALDELRTQRAGPLNDSFQEASKQLSSAASTAQRAGSADPTTSKMTVGAAQQTLGDMNWSRAHGLETYRVLLVTLAKVQPPLPQKEKYAKEAEEVATARKEAVEAAKSAYEAAQTAFAAVRAKGEAKDRLDRLSKQLEKISKYLSGESADLDFTKPLAAPAADEASSETPATPTAAAPTGTPPELLAAIDGLIAASATQDFAQLKPFLYFPPDMAPFVDAMGKAAASQKKLDSALRAKFNASVVDLVKLTPLGAMAAQMGGGQAMGPWDASKLQGVKAADMKVTVSGEKATVVAPGQDKPGEFILAGGKWLFNIGLDKLPPQALEASAKLMPAIGQALEELTTDVTAGKFQTLQAAAVGFMQKLQPIIGQLGGGPGGGGGGG